MRETGLVIKSPVGDLHVPGPPVVLASGPRQAFDLILLSCKAYAGYSPGAPARQVSLKTMTAAGSALTASMLRDIESHGRTEVDQILGDLLHRRKTKPPGPAILAIAHLHVKAYEARRKRELNS